MAASAWIEHVKKYAKEHGIKFGDALKEAKSTYKSQGDSSKKTRAKKGKKARKTASRRK